MRKVILLLLVFILLVNTACDKNEDINSDAIYYVLVKMSGNIAGTETIGSDMEWQENICLFENGTFKKLRVTNNMEVEASGKYTNIFIETEEFIELTYDMENTIIANCTGDLKELLKINANNTLEGTWSYCDGPGLEYESVFTCNTF